MLAKYIAGTGHAHNTESADILLELTYACQTTVHMCSMLSPTIYMALDPDNDGIRSALIAAS